MARNHRLLATRGHLRQLAGDLDGVASDYRLAARRTASLPERRYLTGRAADLEARRPATDLEGRGQAGGP